MRAIRSEIKAVFWHGVRRVRFDKQRTANL